MTITLSNDLPAYPTFTEGIRRAPDRGYRLTPAQTETALRNALRYIPVELHECIFRSIPVHIPVAYKA